MRTDRHIGIHKAWIVGATILSLSMLWFMSVPSVAHAQAETVCSVHIEADGEFVSVFTNQPQNFNLAVLVPREREVSVPMLCEGVSLLALGLTNQEKKGIVVSVQVRNNDGVVICSQEPFTMRAFGARGVTFADCGL
jgi:hypothetical protein